MCYASKRQKKKKVKEKENKRRIKKNTSETWVHKAAARGKETPSKRSEEG
jgi:hypothetical protein